MKKPSILKVLSKAQVNLWPLRPLIPSLNALATLLKMLVIRVAVATWIALRPPAYNGALLRTIAWMNLINRKSSLQASASIEQSHLN
jgi:hypothetical protein